MGVDTTSYLDPNGSGRKSVRVQSKKAYNGALVIADLAHVPGGACGTWPALYVALATFLQAVTDDTIVGWSAPTGPIKAKSTSMKAYT